MRRDQYTAEFYHKVGDEPKPWWNLDGAVDDARLFMALGYAVADGDTWPEWKAGCEFKARRDASLAGAGGR